MANLKESASSLLPRLKALQEDLEPELLKLQNKCSAVKSAAQTINESWSGSWMGYHSALYYANFEPPPLHSQFSPEWGGINGLAEGWHMRTADEVRTRIESMSRVKISELETSTDDFLNKSKAILSDMVIELSGLYSQIGLDQEKKLLGELEKHKWGHTIQEIIDANTPQQAISRDSEAVYQGIRFPAHKYYSALAIQKSSECKAIEDFLQKSLRTVKQIQRNVGLAGLTDGADAEPVRAVLAICYRFHAIAQQLLQRREQRTTLEIEDEYDVQDLLHALLRLYFDDIRPEEWTPSYGGGSSRMDFLLKEHQIVIEAKMTRKGLMAKEVTEQLIIDAAKYRHHSECKTLICLVYDPAGFVKNPRGVERDLAKLSGNGLEVVCSIVP